MELLAKVTHVFTKGFVEIALQDENRACGRSCAACKEPCLLMAEEPELAVAESHGKTARGDIVAVKPAQGWVDRSARLAYVVPLIMFGMGVFLCLRQGGAMGESLGVGAILGLLTLATAWIMNRRARLRRVMQYEITRVCRSE